MSGDAGLNALIEETRARLPGRAERQRRMDRYLAIFGQQMGHFPLVKVTGTNGKGSVVAMLEACLHGSGLPVGAVTSPHLVSPIERVRFNGEVARAAELLPHVEAVVREMRARIAAEGEGMRLSFFEALLFVALAFFKEKGAKIAIFEGGVGGSNDATSALPGALTALTTVAMDHAAELGPTLADIARDKVGMASPGSTLIVGPGVDRGLFDVVYGEARARHVSVIEEHAEGVRLVARGLRPGLLQVARGPLSGSVELPLLGRFQAQNASVVLAVMERLKDLGVVRDVALEGLSKAAWPARMEVVSAEPAWLLDVAHNEEGLRALSAALDELVPCEKRVLVYGASADKDTKACAPWAQRLATRLALVGGFHRAAQPDALMREHALRPFALFDSPEAAWQGLDVAPDDVVVAAGSLYMVGALRERIMAARTRID